MLALGIPWDALWELGPDQVSALLEGIQAVKPSAAEPDDPMSEDDRG